MELDEKHDVVMYRNQIQRIKSAHKSDFEVESVRKKIKTESIEQYSTMEVADPMNNFGDDDDNSIKSYIRNQIKISEQKILNKMDQIERKLNQLIALTRGEPVESEPEIANEPAYENEEHIIEEFVTDNDLNEQHEALDEYSSLIFPIVDENTFDWFMMKLTDEEYRSNLVNRRWTLTRNVGTRSFNVSVKDFLRMHFDLSVCIKYSVSGFGSRGTKKKKVDAKTLSVYVHDCFCRSHPNMFTLQDVSKAITQFFGRSHDTYTKMHNRALRRELMN